MALHPFLVSQTPIPRKISAACQKVLDPVTDNAAVSCKECLKLGDTELKEEVEEDPQSFECEQITVSVEDGDELKPLGMEENQPESNETDVKQEMARPKRGKYNLSGKYKKRNRDAEEEIAEEVATPMRRKPHTLWKTKVNTSKTEQLNVKCGPCGEIFETRTDYERHREDRHDGGTMHMKCKICGAISMSNFFFRHMRAQHGVTKIPMRKCDWCPEVRSSSSIKTHALKAHFYGRFTCAICTFRGDFARELMDHMAQDHKEVGTGKCPICDQESSLDNIENHYRNCVKIKLTKQVNKGDYCEQVCPTCGKILKSRSGYRAHLRTHLPKGDPEKKSPDKHFCDKCGKTFAKPYLLKAHIGKEHDKMGVKYPCQSCDLVFDDYHSMNRHKLKVHSTDKRYECRYCGIRKTAPSMVRAHERVHEEAKFECRHCKKMLKTEKALVIHERIHTGEKPFKCALCPAGFGGKESLRCHMAGAHNIAGPKGRLPGWQSTRNKRKRREELRNKLHE